MSLPPQANGPVLEGGSRAGRAPWRLPARAGQTGLALDSARTGDLDVRAASVIGAGHRCAEPATVRQDAYALALDSSGSHLVVAVADGISASPHSDLGARAAVSTAVREIACALDRDPEPGHIDPVALFGTVAGEMVGTGRARGHDERDICCVLAVATVPTRPGPDGSRHVWTAQVGDVSVWTHSGRLEQRTGVPKEGLDPNAVSAVLPFHPGAVTLSRIAVPPGGRVAVLTDGVGDLLTDVVSAPPFFEDAWSMPPHPATFLLDLCADAPGQTDDRTAVVVWCGAGAGTEGSP